MVNNKAQQYLMRPRVNDNSEVAAFEQEFASFVGVAHSIGVANGTDAIELLLRALEINGGSSVAVPSQTAVASVSAIVRAGATPLFVDVDPVTFTMLPESLDQAIHSPVGTQLKAVLAVHLYGHPAEMDKVRWLRQYGWRERYISDFD